MIFELRKFWIILSEMIWMVLSKFWELVKISGILEWLSMWCILLFVNYLVKYLFYGVMFFLNELRFYKNILCVFSEVNIFEIVRLCFSNSYFLLKY